MHRDAVSQKNVGSFFQDSQNAELSAVGSENGQIGSSVQLLAVLVVSFDSRIDFDAVFS